MGRNWKESFLSASHGMYWGWNVDENQCAGLSMCTFYPQMRFINFLRGFIFIACPKDTVGLAYTGDIEEVAI